jgi:hypothetical protein
MTSVRQPNLPRQGSKQGILDLLLPCTLTWLLLRLYTSVGAAFFSKIRPITPIEKDIALWPPPAMAIWLNRVFLAPWLRWDAVWYANILAGGYAAGNGSTSFHPLYVVLSTPLYWLGLDPLLSLLITSSLASLGLFWIFYKLASLDLPPEGSRVALVLLATFPVALILFAPYTESVFLFFSILALYQMRLRRWLPAALSTCLAALARQQGVLLMFPMLWYAWEDSGRSLRGLARGWRGWLACLAAPAGLILWGLYRIYFLQEGALDTHDLQGLIYSALISPSAKVIFPDQSFLWPWNALVIALPRLAHNPDIGDVMSIALGVGFVLLFALAWSHMRSAERLYSLAIVLVSFSASTGPIRIYLSLPRHLLLAAPVFIGLAAALKKRWQYVPLIGLQLLTQAFMLYLYVTKSWIP